MAGDKLLTGKIVVFTGTLSMPRSKATSMAERSGATVVSSVTNACNVIVAGPGAGSKLAIATNKGIEVWTEAEFLRKMTIEEIDERLTTNNGRVIENTGDSKFQFSLSWDDFVDLDIHLITPKGLCFYRDRKVAGAELDVDRMPQFGKTSWEVLPVENIVCDKAFPGKYICKVVFFSNFMSTTSVNVPFTVRCRVGTHDNIVQGVLPNVKDEVIICAFDVDQGGRITNYVELPDPALYPSAKPQFIAPVPLPKPAKAARRAPVVPAKKTTAKKAPAKKTTAKKAPAKKAPAKKTTAKKAPAKKAPAKKTTAKKAPAKKTTAKKAPAKKTTAKKAPAKKAPAKKTTAKKAPAKKAPAKKTTAKKAPAKKAPAKKTTAKKAPAKKAPAKKTTAKKAPAKKAPAKKTTAKKAPAKKAPAKKKTTAKKAPAKKAPVKKTPAKKVARKAPVKKTPAKKVARKAPVKKAPVKKVAAKKRK